MNRREHFVAREQHALNASVDATVLEDLKLRFAQLWGRCLLPAAAVSSEPVWTDLIRHYQGFDRHYHTMRHINHCLARLDLARRYLLSPDTVEMALWFHDVICVAGAQDNEQRSAEYFAQVASGNFETSFTARVSELIISTMHNANPRDYDERFLRDIDLSSFALPWEEFFRDSRAIRAEHAETPDDLYFTAKKKYLTAMLDRPAIYLTEFFHERFEAAARQNIRHTLEKIAQERLDH